MSKYIIEIEDEPFVRRSALYGEEGLYRAKGFNTLVFDKNGLEKLTPLDKELEEAYQMGKHDAEQDLAKAAYDEAYQKGVHDGSLDVKQRVGGAYQKGYDEAKLIYQNPNAESDYQRGLDYAWEAARKICTNWMISDQTLAEIFGQCKDIDTIMHENTAQEAIDKIKSYETKQETDKIKVGDEVTPKSNDSNWLGVVVGVDDTNAMVMTRDGYTAMYRLEILKKTNKHFPQMVELLRGMKEGAE